MAVCDAVGDHSHTADNGLSDESIREQESILDALVLASVMVATVIVAVRVTMSEPWPWIDS